MSNQNIHFRFHHFVDTNLQHVDEESGCKMYELYEEFTKVQWEGENMQSLLADPENLSVKAKQFVELISRSETEPISWFVVGRQVQLNDSTFQRCLNLYKSRFLNVKLSNNAVVDLNVLDYLNKMNSTQVALRLPKARPCISSHTARLMRELWLIKKKYNIDYKIRKDDVQLKQILKEWFNANYTLKCDTGSIGYPRRKLLEEANDFLVRQFGDTKLLYCHAEPWRWLMKEIIGMDDSDQKGGNYLRLPVWKKDKNGQPMLNARKSVGTGGEFSLEKRAKERLSSRHATARERDCARKARDNKRKKRKTNVL